ncbi:glycerophosphodiester phosphodiesterase family protein [Hahella ganghwensis]|uniref:glycerophosphodiester phosphodiesterase family protein n=1 Tax=Hahella ganghwensis TaxID=286420 RepID=UPI000367C8C5|nr:glycerophosphodiester phosphodiesterase family protein [Hahella ganghwensis]
MRIAMTVLSLTAATLLFPISNAYAEEGDQSARNHDKHGKNLAQVGPRPFYLVKDMDESNLKNKLEQCGKGPFYRTDFSIGHRGAAMQFPEHTKESYEAAAAMGAGIVECDVTFTKDRELVCRHSQCDLHTTTNILAVPDLAAKCSQPFTPANPAAGTQASAMCCTSDITLAEFKTLKGKMDAFNPNATTVEEYMDATADWRTDLYDQNGTLLSHVESIELFKSLGVKYTPELKSPSVEMPYEGDYTQEAYAQQMIDEYQAAGIHPKKVWAQSFNLNDILYWIENTPRFGRQAVYLDGRYDNPDFNPNDPETWNPKMRELVEKGVKVIAPPAWVLVKLDQQGKIASSAYAKAANDAGLKIITWTLERSGPLASGGGWYYQSITDAIDNDGDVMNLMHVLAQDVGVIGIFSDWPGTVTYYANCMGLK